MALETLEDINKIDKFEVRHIGNDLKMEESENPFIIVNDDENTIKFKIQKDPIKEVGVNGCQVGTIIAVARTIIKGLNDQFPCEENIETIMHLDKALEWLKKRTANRVTRGVEGTNQA